MSVQCACLRARSVDGEAVAVENETSAFPLAKDDGLARLVAEKKRSMNERGSLVVDRLDPSDARTFAECVVLDTLAFPHTSAYFGLRGMHTWIARAVDARRVLGFLAAEFTDAAVHIRGLAVQPDARRRGAGRALLGAALQDARSAGKRVALLEVAVGNRAAIVLYASEGFVIRRRVAGYYTAAVFGGPDAYQMVRRLEQPK